MIDALVHSVADATGEVRIAAGLAQASQPAAEAKPSASTEGNRSRCGSREARLGLRWYCGQTHSGDHFRARDELVKQGFEAHLPLCCRLVPGGALRIEPLFGPYLIVRFDVAKPGWRSICNTRGMRRLFGATPEQPTPLREADAQAIRDLTISGDVHGPAIRGEALRVVGGPDAYRGRAGLCVDVAAGVVRALLFTPEGVVDCEILAKWCRRA